MSVFEQLQQAFKAGGIRSALGTAEAQLREQDRFHELFEILKMKSRNELGLPLLHQEEATLSDDQQRALEDGLLEACRDVGFALLNKGRIQDSWVYLRHLGENEKVVAQIRKIEPNEENLDQIIGLLLHEGLDSERGYELVLSNYGTCNAITTIQSTMYGRSKAERQAAGRLLVAHVHNELLENVKAHVEREQKEVPAENRLAEIASGRDYLFADGAYHIDTSHLSSTVAVAGELTDRTSIELAYDLTQYGQRLDSVLQYAGEAPFEDTYPTYSKYFAAQLGMDVDESLDFFRQRAEATDAHQEGTYPIEAYIELLARIGRPAEAIDASVNLIPAGIQTTGRGPSLYDLSEQLNDFAKYKQLCTEREDLLGYVISLGK